MAKRPIFIPQTEGHVLVMEKDIEFVWHSGFAPIQKKKNIVALHKAASEINVSPLLEISTKSNQLLGIKLSAFNLHILLDNGRSIPVECAFQGSKVFENNGPYRDIFGKSTREAKKDERLKNSGAIIGFSFEGVEFETEPKTAFYDWIYIKAVMENMETIEDLDGFNGFTDIEFNPNKSINCQARSCALLVALSKRNILNEALSSPKNFIEASYKAVESPSEKLTQPKLL